MSESILNAEQIQATVLGWWEPDSRDVPWRATRDPWAVLVSEVMSQQTQVARVVPKWQAFMAAFPTVGDAAAAPVSDVVRHWDGLGYNRRAVHLHNCAQEIVTTYAGTFPGDLPSLLRLPGVGPYTARALLAFAFESDVGVLDTNVGRVLARWLGTQLDGRRAQELADDLVPTGKSWRWNQALLDFGAAVCSKRNPECESCPMYATCGWQGVGTDPAAGSAGVSGRQSRFEGSDRQGRGRLVAALRAGRVAEVDLTTVMKWPDEPDRAAAVARGVVSDGLAIHIDGIFSLP